MNIVQMKERMMFLFDHVASPRFSNSQYENAINVAIDMIVEDCYDNIKVPKRYSFESVEKIRDRLYTLIASHSAVPVSNKININMGPTNDYKYTLYCELTIDSELYVANPTTHDNLKEDQENPYLRPRLEKPYQVYWLQTNDGTNLVVQFYVPDGKVVTLAKTIYLRVPATVTMGTEIFAGSPIPNGVIAIANDYVTMALGGPYIPGALITGTGANVLTGSVVTGWVNSDLPEPMHNEICKLASAVITGTVSDYQKYQFLNNEANKQ